VRFDQTAEELERLLLQKEGESLKDNAVQTRTGAGGKRAIGKAVAKGGLLLKGKNPASIQRQEDDVRGRMSAASDAYRKAVVDTQTIRQEYFNFQLPRILRVCPPVISIFPRSLLTYPKALKECADEIDLGTQYHLTRYAFLFESIMLSDGATLAPTGVEDGAFSCFGFVSPPAANPFLIAPDTFLSLYGILLTIYGFALLGRVSFQFPPPCRLTRDSIRARLEGDNRIDRQSRRLQGLHAELRIRARRPPTWTTQDRART